MQVLVKRFFPARQIAALASFLHPAPPTMAGPGSVPGGSGGAGGGGGGGKEGSRDHGAVWVEPGVRCTRNDGVVFVPLRRPYYQHNALKWKPPGCTTVDFAVAERDVAAALRAGATGAQNKEGGLWVYFISFVHSFQTRREVSGCHSG